MRCDLPAFFFLALHESCVFSTSQKRYLDRTHILVLRLRISNIYSVGCNTDLFSLVICVSLILLIVQIGGLYAKLLLLGH